MGEHEKEHILVRPTCEAITDVPRRAVEWSNLL